MSHFKNFTESFHKGLSEISSKTQEISSNLPSMAQSTHRMMQEKLGHVTDISQLPQEYIELERKIDTIKMINQHFLQITSIYENESYDYPKYVKDSVNDFSKDWAAKATELTKAMTTNDIHSILNAPGPVRDPKTLNYALSKVSLSSSELIKNTSGESITPDETKIVSTLLEYSNVQSQVAQQRLAQDKIIATKFNKNLRDELAIDIEKAMRARKEVYNKRIQYDIARTNLQNAKPEKEAALRVQMESLEDQFAQVTENTTIIMQDVISKSQFLLDLKDLAEAQLEYFENSAKLLREFVEDVKFPMSEERHYTASSPPPPVTATESLIGAQTNTATATAGKTTEPPTSTTTSTTDSKTSATNAGPTPITLDE